jgi:phage terminase large subunit GpA-like protein
MARVEAEQLISTEYSELVFDAGFWAGLRPDPILTVSEWADEHRVLAQVSSAMPGRWRTSRTPYLRKIQDCLSVMHPCQEVVFIKGAQIGGTEAGNNWLAYLISEAPGPMMAVLPTIDLAKKSSKTRIKPLIENCEKVKAKIGSTKSRDGGNTLLMKEFAGGVLILSGANSAVSLRSQPVRFLMLDEIDGYPDDVDGEGDPVGLAEARTRTYLRRKIYKVSTPTFEGRSKIQSAWLESDMQRYYVPCPHCLGMQWLKWSQVQWPKEPEEQPLKAWYVCELCEKPIAERYKKWMLQEKGYGGLAEWRAEKPGAAEGKVVGFHLSALYSPFGSYTWGDAARQWVKSQGKSDKLREFVNTVLGETWKEKGDAPEWEVLYSRREKYAEGFVHESVVFITAGVDVQKDRLEVELVGWCKDKQSYSVGYIIIVGDTALERDQVGSPWAELDQLLSKTWSKASGLELPITKMGVDTGYNTQHVYSWIRNHPITRVMALKGYESLSMPLGVPTAVDVKQGGKRVRRGLKLWPVGTGHLKGELYSWLQLHPPTDEQKAAGKGYPYGYCHYPEYSEEFFKQVTAEQLVVRVVKGRRKYEWEKTRERNEALDCRVYARAAAASVGMDRFTEQQWLNFAGRSGIVVPPARGAEGTDAPAPEPGKPRGPAPPRRKSSFL